MNEEQSGIPLTVAQLIEDLKALPQDIEVAVILHGGGLTIPINNLMKLTADERTLALLVVHEENVRRALDVSMQKEATN